MSASDGTAAASQKGAAARAEKGKKPKTLKFKGVTLELPPELPDTILFDITALKHAGNNAGPIFDLLFSIVGESQFFEIRNKIGVTDDLGTLFEKILGKYGLNLGNSPASRSS